MSCSTSKSNYKRQISASALKRTANGLNHNAWGWQGLISHSVRNQVAVILDTCKLLTLHTLLERYHNRFKTIYIVQIEVGEHAAIALELAKLKHLLDRHDYPDVLLKKGDVFNFLSDHNGKIDYVWIDFEQAVLRKDQMLVVESMTRDLKCLTITLAARAHIRGRGRSIKCRTVAMKRVFQRYLPCQLLDFAYDAGGGPMRLIAFGKRSRDCITMKSFKITGLFDHDAPENELDVD